MSATVSPDASLVALVEGYSAAPRILAELNRQLRRFFPSVDEVTALLRRDATLVSRVLKLANSALFAGAEPAATIEEAVTRVGLREVHRLVGIAAICPSGLDGLALYGISGTRFREHSLMSALLLEELAKRTNEDAPTCYVIGLMRPIGRLALDRAGRNGATPLRFDPAAGVDLVDWERSHFGLANHEAAAAILTAWNFPDEASAAVRDHYEPGKRHNPLAHLLHLTAYAVEFLQLGLPGEAAYWEDSARSHDRAGCTPFELQQAIEAARRTFDRLAPALA